MKKILSWHSMILLFALLFLSTEGAWSYDPISLKAYQSIGTYHKSMTTLPVSIEVTNYGPTFQGMLEVNHSASYGQLKKLIYSTVELPQNSQKQFFLYIPEYQYYNPSLQIDLKTLSGKQTIGTSSINVDHVQPKDFLVLVLSRDQAGFEYLTSPKLKKIISKDAQIYITYPSTSHLPPNWAGYESADLMILCNYPALSISLDQQKAIRDWVLSGGVLFISSSLSPSEFSQSALDEILPVTPQETLQLQSTSAIESFAHGTPLEREADKPLLATGAEPGKSDVLLWEGKSPLLSRKNFGRGAVYYFACDITKPPFSTWSGNVEFWSRVLSSIVLFRKGAPAFADDSSPLSSMPQVRPPSKKNLSIFLFSYILIVGPLNYLFLRRKDRMLYTFLTVPLIAIIFTFSSFLFGYFTKGSSVLFRTVSMCEMERELTAAPLTSYFSLFSPGIERYDIHIRNPRSIAWELSTQGGKEFTLQWKEGLTIKDIAMDMWSMRRFKSRQVLTFPGTIDLSVRESHGVLSGTVKNGLEVKLNNCIIITGSRVSELFTIRKGENVVNLKLSRTLSNPYELSSHFINTYKIVPNADEMDIKREQMSFLYYFSSTYFARQERGNPVILGWSDQNTGGIAPGRSNYRAQHSTFFIIH